jgi:HEAT repeat protein
MAGHRGNVAAAAGLVGHHDPAVRAAALGALARAGALDVAILSAAAADADPSVRRRACLLAGRALAGDGPGAPALVAILTAMLSHETEAPVVEVAAWALGEAGAGCGPDTVCALEAVASGHPDPLCREAAVAALGAVGNPSALGTVIGALEDKPAVRRRAVVALAAFDDRRVDDALRRCLDDRDWQVRQAAEDLLARP